MCYAIYAGEETSELGITVYKKKSSSLLHYFYLYNNYNNIVNIVVDVINSLCLYSHESELGYLGDTVLEQIPLPLN